MKPFAQSGLFDKETTHSAHVRRSTYLSRKSRYLLFFRLRSLQLLEGSVVRDVSIACRSHGMCGAIARGVDGKLRVRSRSVSSSSAL